MATIDFPSSPVLGDTYTFGARTWIWNGSGWERQINAGQTVSVFTSPGVIVDLTITKIPYTVGGAWNSVNYV
jgi:hypothetical protein